MRLSLFDRKDTTKDKGLVSMLLLYIRLPLCPPEIEAKRKLPPAARKLG